MKKYFIVLLLTIPILQACEEKQKSDFKANFYVRYDEGGKVLKAEATFYEEMPGGESENIVFEGGVSFLGGGMATNSLPGGTIRYAYEQTGNLPEQLNFNWRHQGEAVDVAFELPAVDFTLVTEDTVRQAQPLPLALTTPPLQPDEKILILLTDSKNRSQRFEVNNLPNDFQISLEAKQLASLAPGIARMHLVRTKTQQFQHGLFDISATLEYYTNTRAFHIHPE